MISRKVIFVVGPTAVGKTRISNLLAKKLKGEIVSCDAMQVYKEVNIASCKPSKATLNRIPSHLFNVVSIKKNFDVALFRQKAMKAIKDIQQKKRIPIVVGGSGLYMMILLDGIFEGPKEDINLRRSLQEQAKRDSRNTLYRRLQKVDPEAAKEIHPQDKKRIIRALEVFMLTKKTISSLQKNREGLWGKYDVKIFALNRERLELYDLINRRVERMFKDGLVEEIKSLSKRKWSQTAQSIIGVREVQGYLDGEYDLERAKYLIKLKTRRYAKRQLTWFRRDERLDWIEIIPQDTPSKVVSRMLRRIWFL